LEELLNHQIVHFACHGELNEDPSKSRLLLDDWETSPLTVADLTALNMSLSQFAYLSACHSANMKDRRLLSESINLASAFQLAGFASVVGTLWEVAGEPSADIAYKVYEGMLAGQKLDIERSAESLHHVVRDYRDRMADIPLIWAPYIHLGV
jgi:CHAT domain-containing protein